MNVWVAVMATVALMFLVVIPVGGVVLFHPQRARNVRHAERATETVQKHITEIAIFHPEISKRGRFDRHPFYVAPMVGAFGYAACILTGAAPTNNVAALSDVTRFTMASCFIVGATFILAGTTLGVRIGRFTIAPRVRDHPTAPLLGDDVTLPYWLACAGLACVTVSMGIYAATSFKSTSGSLGGWLTATLAGAAGASIVHFYIYVREFERNEAVLVAEVMARIERGH